MEPTGVIFAALDCDADAIEEWNRWYDLEHTPMNLCLPGVMLSRRYVAPPALHAVRLAADTSAFARGRATFLTTYLLTGDPRGAFQSMSNELPRLYEEGRMRFPADKKTVRDGDVFRAESAACLPALGLRADEVPFVQHCGVVVVLSDEDHDRVRQAQGVDGVIGAWSLSSMNRPLHLDMFFVDRDPAACAVAIRRAVPHPAPPIVDAPFLLINPLHYPWADDIRGSHLPQTIA